MGLPHAPLSELEAVNIMLSVIDEQPVATIPTEGVSEPVMARNTLQQSSRMIQSKGPRCSCERDYTLHPAAPSKEIRVPRNTLNIEVEDPSEDIVLRGTRLYDRKNHTYQFEKPLKVGITFMLKFEELPEHVRYYIAINAARKFQKQVLGSETHDRFTYEDEMEAKLTFHRRELTNKDLTFLNSPGAININMRII
jgi:hypothetical protein